MGQKVHFYLLHVFLKYHHSKNFDDDISYACPLIFQEIYLIDSKISIS